MADFNINRFRPNSGRSLREDSSVINLADNIYNNTDAFGKRVVKNYKNVADIGSHYPHSPERHRLYINGTRFLLQYNNTAKFEDGEDYYRLKPAAGDTMRYRTAERYRYVVNYILQVSTALEINQSLVGDDKIVLGYGDDDIENDMANANGWFWEFRGDTADDTVFYTTYRNGTLLNEKQAKLRKPITEWIRMEDEINWYNVGNRIARQTYTVDGIQYNPIIAQTSVDGQRGPSRGNFPFTFAIKADAATTGLELTTGSVGVNILGNIVPTFRPKEAFQIAAHTGSGNWEPLFAIKKADSHPNVFINVTDVEILEVSTDADVDVMAIACDSTETDASNFVAPEYHSATNSAVRETTTITTFPAEDGSVVTSSSTTGGYQIGLTGYRTQGTGTANRRANFANGVRKRSIANGDIIVFIARTSTAMNIEVAYETEQEW